jgi:AbrB family looped-hinge helix DNA binding protein
MWMHYSFGYLKMRKSLRSRMGGKELNVPTSTLTTKGQITIPKRIRELLHLPTGRRVGFHVDSNGKRNLDAF